MGCESFHFFNVPIHALLFKNHMWLLRPCKKRVNRVMAVSGRMRAAPKYSRKAIAMKKYFLVGLAMAFGMVQPVFAQDSTPTETPTPALSKPVSLSAKERLSDSRRYGLPAPPAQLNDGTPVTLENDVDDAPSSQAMAGLVDPSSLDPMASANKDETTSGKYYWHSFKAGNYCHVKKDGQDWYGWRTGDGFEWALWWGGRFWWHDNYAERSLYFNDGSWWWQSPKKAGNYQVFLPDGHYHVCSAQGVVGDDLMRTGTEEVETQPVEKETPSADRKESGGVDNGGPGMGGF